MTDGRLNKSTLRKQLIIKKLTYKTQKKEAYYFLCSFAGNNKKLMPQESRLKKSLLNARVNLIFYVLSLALSFFSRKIFLDALGADFMGLIGTLNNLLGFLNLADRKSVV